MVVEVLRTTRRKDRFGATYSEVVMERRFSWDLLLVLYVCRCEWESENMSFHCTCYLHAACSPTQTSRPTSAVEEANCVDTVPNCVDTEQTVPETELSVHGDGQHSRGGGNTGLRGLPPSTHAGLYGLYGVKFYPRLQGAIAAARAGEACVAVDTVGQAKAFAFAEPARIMAHPPDVFTGLYTVIGVGPVYFFADLDVPLVNNWKYEEAFDNMREALTCSLFKLNTDTFPVAIQFCIRAERFGVHLHSTQPFRNVVDLREFVGKINLPHVDTSVYGFRHAFRLPGYGKGQSTAVYCDCPRLRLTLSRGELQLVGAPLGHSALINVNASPDLYLATVPLSSPRVSRRPQSLQTGRMVEAAKRLVLALSPEFNESCSCHIVIAGMDNYRMKIHGSNFCVCSGRSHLATTPELLLTQQWITALCRSNDACPYKHWRWDEHPEFLALHSELFPW